MSQLDVLLIGGYSLGESWHAGERFRDQMRLYYKNHPVTLNFVKHLVRNGGDLTKAESLFQAENSSRLVSRSLNTIYLSSVLGRHGISCQSIGYFLHEHDLFENIIKLKPRIVAISTTFISDAREVQRIAEEVRQHSEDSIIVVGGIKVLKSYRKYCLDNQLYFEGFDISQMKETSFFFDPSMDEAVDVFVVEECGELTLLELARAVKEKRNYKSVPNLAFRDGKELRFTEFRREPYSFDDNPIDWANVPSDQIGQEIPVRAGMGCAFKCAFCDFVGLHKVKMRGVSTVVEELTRIQHACPGIPVFFTDDNLFTNVRRTQELAQGIINASLRFRWRAFFRVDAISEENIELLAKSGCSSAFLGVESGDDTILANMNKRATRAQALKAVQLLSDHGINTLSFIIIGFPGETRDSVDRSIDLLNSYPQTTVPINQYYPMSLLMFPLSPLVSPQNRKKWNIKGGTYQWSHSTMNSDEAKEQLLRLFREVTVPVLPYLEYIDPEIPYGKIYDVAKTRENIVKSGVSVLDSTNSKEIAAKFAAVLN